MTKLQFIAACKNEAFSAYRAYLENKKQKPSVARVALETFGMYEDWARWIDSLTVVDFRLYYRATFTDQSESRQMRLL